MTDTLLSEIEIATLVAAGGHAPSGGNAQPWLVRMSGNVMELWLDGQRSSSFLDVGRYASVFALGAFAENVLTAAPGLGLRVDIRLADSIGLEHPLAYISFVRDTTLEPHSLASYIVERVTNRKPHTGPEIEKSVLSVLRGSMSHGSRLHATNREEDRQAAAEILGEGDVLRIRNRQLNHEMWSEVRWTPAEVGSTRDGIDIETLEVPEEGIGQLRMLQDHDFVMHNVADAAITGMTAAAIMASSHICVSSIEPDSKPDPWFSAGRDIQQLWLQATSLGLSIQPWTALTFIIVRAEYFAGRELSAGEIVTSKRLLVRLRELFDIPDSRVPIFVFRLFRGVSPSARSLRRHVADYITLDK